ncbi:Transducin family protein [Dorcoceras hygrometricum]|uniref:Transducin family protein n=1 Tax=Dorcoceras hygrometricum TaxID=472368 RepID=A0A2Z7DEJ5_9LAMI|nr:Transducin family protein [Dorcoceras hygrometricum]
MDTTAFCLHAKDSADALCDEENQQVLLSRETSRTLLNGKNFVSNGINSNRGYICEGNAIEEVSHTVAAGVHLWSLGVLAAAGCGIGSVHEFAAAKFLRKTGTITMHEERDNSRRLQPKKGAKEHQAQLNEICKRYVATPTTNSKSGINRKINCQGVQRHRSCSKQRRETMGIDGSKLR